MSVLRSAMAGVCVLVTLAGVTSCSFMKDLGSKSDAGKPAEAVTSTPSRVPVTAKTSYVALGDSYAAGVKISPIVADAPAGCSRSQVNYAHLVAQRKGIVDFVDVTCSGATTVDMAAPQKVAGSPPPQLDALRSDTGLVTLGVGGNDFGFTEVLRTCGEKALSLSLTPCKDFYTADGRDELARRIEEIGPRIAGTLDAIKRRAPKARVLVVSYPSILPESGFGCPTQAPFAPGDLGYLRTLVPGINEVLAERAQAAGVEYVNLYTPSLGHDVCQSDDTKWVEGARPAAGAAPVHPNVRGHQSAAETILAHLG
ncbi:SGNH/GDSL hydrolase family protein [Embleya hyalina]|uniref:Lipase n=1 Tax=Embleya hyalina TaxID=516124 RepID=A0A401YQJ0_9ACTN|nr:SGNH/GDSL hydrolase family protein [Embleya hyalina]GCD96879.1 lipase [Embleya hyalina]